MAELTASAREFLVWCADDYTEAFALRDIIRRLDPPASPHDERAKALAIFECLSFVVRLLGVDVLPSAGRHGIEPGDIEHAIRHALVVEEVGDDPVRYLVLGPDRAGNLLELVVLDRPQGPAAIHAMQMRPQYQRLLPKR